MKIIITYCPFSDSRYALALTFVCAGIKSRHGDAIEIESVGTAERTGAFTMVNAATGKVYWSQEMTDRYGPIGSNGTFINHILDVIGDDERDEFAENLKKNGSGKDVRTRKTRLQLAKEQRE